MSVKAIPDGYHSVTPYLSIQGAAEAIDFYRRAFGATERLRLPMPDGRIGHAEICIGDSTLMLSDPCEQGALRSAQSLLGSAVGLYLYVEDVDGQFAQAIKAGAKVIMPVQDQFYGDRSGTLKDPFGHVWTLATRKEELSAEEIGKRLKAMFKNGSHSDAPDQREGIRAIRR